MKSEGMEEVKVGTKSSTVSFKKLNTSNVPILIDESVIKRKLQRLNMNLNDYKHLF